MPPEYQAVTVDVSLTPDARRKPGCGGITVRMADGQDWVVRRPRAVWVPDDTEDAIDLAFDLGPEYDALYQRLEKATDRMGEMKAIFAMAKHLLALNYDLAPGEFKSLLRLDFRAADEGQEESDGARLARELQTIMVGGQPAPKATPGG